MAATVIAFYLLDIPCLFKALLKIPCPGCGMTRAYLSLFRLELGQAFAWHPMFWSVPLLVLLYFLDGKLFKTKWLNTALLIALGVGFLVHWIMLLLGK